MWSWSTVPCRSNSVKSPLRHARRKVHHPLRPYGTTISSPAYVLADVVSHELIGAVAPRPGSVFTTRGKSALTRNFDFRLSMCGKELVNDPCHVVAFRHIVKHRSFGTEQIGASASGPLLTVSPLQCHNAMHPSVQLYSDSGRECTATVLRRLPARR